MEDTRVRKPIQRAIGRPFSALFASEGYCWVSSDVPGGNFGYPNIARMNSIYDFFGVLRANAWGLFKFATVAQGFYNYVVLTNLDTNFAGPRGEANYPAVGVFTTTFKLDLYAILADYDPSTITWTQAQALSISASRASLSVNSYIDTSGVTTAGAYGVDPDTIVEDLIFDNGNTYKIDLDGAYGMLVKATVNPARSSGRSDARLTNTGKDCFALKGIFE